MITPNFGYDPLRELIERLRLSTIPMRGGAVILRAKILNTNRDIRRKLVETTLAAINAFHKECEALCTADDYYDDYWRAEKLHPLANKTFAELLNGIPDEIARRYVATAAHADGRHASPDQRVRRHQERPYGQRTLFEAVRHQRRQRMPG